MAAVSGVVGAVFGALTYANSLVGEGWTRYFVILGGLFVDNQVGNFTGIYALEGLISSVVINVFGIPNFVFPVHYGVSSLLIIAIMAPIFLKKKHLILMA